MMNIWKILEIDPTEDKKKIKSAYRAKLRTVNPETQQEAFMELREAYEQALKYQEAEETHSETSAAADAAPGAAQSQNSEKQSSLEQWRVRLEQLYKDNARRFQTNAWEELFHDDICYSLDTRDEAGREFMAFFADHIYISQEALKKADAVFHFTEKMDELQEYFPYPLLDYFINYKLKEEEFPQYVYFAGNPLPDADYDEYIETFRELCEAFDEDNRERIQILLKRLDETGIRHPSVEIKRAQFYSEEEQKITEILQSIEDTWGEFDEAVFTKGEILLGKKKPEEAEPYFRRTLELNPDFEKALVLLAVSLKEQKRFTEARDLLLESKNMQMRLDLSGFLDELEACIIQDYEKQMQDGSMKEAGIYDLALAYYRNDQLENAQKTIDMLSGNEEWEIKYMRVCSLILDKQKDWEKALSLTEALILKLEAAEKNSDHLRYLAESYMICGTIKMNQGKKEEALEMIDKGIELSGNQEDYLLKKISVLMGFDFYELAADTLSVLVEKNPRNIMYRFGRGMCYFRANALSEAHEDFEYICMMDEDNLYAHIYRMRIYLEAQAQQDVEETFQFFEEKGFHTDSVRLMRGIYQEYSGDYKNAETTFEEIIKGYDPEKSDLENIGEVYLHLAQVEVELDKRGHTVFKYLNEGLEKDPEYIPLLEKRCEINEAFEDKDDMKKDLMRILALNPYHEAANIILSNIYEEDGDMEKSNEYLDVVLQSGKNQIAYTNKAINQVLMGDMEDAWKLLESAAAIDDESTNLHQAKAFYYSVTGEYEKAIELYTALNEEVEEKKYYAKIGVCYCHLGDFDGAREQYQLIAEHGEKENAYSLLFELELRQGRYKEAEKALKLWQKARKKLLKDDAYKIKAGKLCVEKREYKKAKELLELPEVTDSFAREQMGALYLFEGKAKKALKYLLSGMKEWPDNVEFYYYAAMANLLLGNREEVERIAREGLIQQEKDPKPGVSLKENYKNLATFHYLLGDFEKAQMYFDEALKMPMCNHCQAQKCHEVYSRMAVMYHLMGDSEKCQEAFANAGSIAPDDLDYTGLKMLVETGKLPVDKMSL